MTILEQQGFFWWHDEPVPDDSLTPASYASGLLRIEDNGRSVVELDGYPPDPSDPMGKCIQGLLKVSNERILLSDLRWSGGEFRSNGISFTRFTAMNCLVGHDEAFPHGAQVPEFDSLEIPLDGFEEWLGLGTIKVTRADGKILAGYEKPSDLSYDYDGGTLTITFDVTVDKSGMLGVHRLLLKQSALLRLQLNGTFSLQDLHLQYGMMEDLIKLLTNSDYALAWPRVSSPSGLTCQWYHTRTKHKESASAPEYHDTITRFSELREQFGSIWSKWIALREEIGSGAYMYFGTRRGPELYMEHRFVSLIWGLETFHRSRNTIKKSNALDEKIDRIINQITRKKDKDWLQNRLKDAREPNLAQRLFEMFQTLPFGLQEAKMCAFSKSCAKRRNDLSHFGGQRQDTPRLEFLQDLTRKSNALSILYHAVLLRETGISDEILTRWFYKSFISFQIKFCFVEVGLLDPAVPQAPKPT